MPDAPTDRPDRVLPGPPALPPDAALFVDIDGTLAGFEIDPDAVRLGPVALKALEAARAQVGGALALLSGRALDQVDRICAPARFAAAGLHGVQRRTPDGRVVALEVPATRVERMREFLREALRQHPGLRLEDKQASFALHYRGNPALEAAAHAIAADAAAATGHAYVLQRGDLVVELKPSGADKGTALGALMRVVPFAGRVPVALGDDWTDEDAFLAAQALGGFGIIVGRRRPTAARYALADPAAVIAWLADGGARAA